MRYLFYYKLIIEFLGLFIMGIDKFLAKQESPYRIPEKVLFGVAFIGGCLGCWAGMYIFRHKTQHWYFVWGMPAILLFHIGLVAAYFIFIN